jgi:hypothetical protein
MNSLTLQQSQFDAQIHQLAYYWPDLFSVSSADNKHYLSSIQLNRLIPAALLESSYSNNSSNYETKVEIELVDEIFDEISHRLQQTEPVDENSLACNASLLCEPKFCHYTIQYHILYSCSYSVPQLYFILQDISNGSIIEPEIALKILHYQSQHSTINGTDKLNNDLIINKEEISVNSWVSQEFHPLLNIPYYTIHPCQTASLMFNIQNANISCDTAQHFSMLSWLSLLSPFVGLKLPINERLVAGITEGVKSVSAAAAAIKRS